MINNELLNYSCFNEEEENDKKLILDFLNNYNNAYERENKLAHVTASSWIVNKDKTKVLMVYHNIYDSWSWTGGHADGEKDLLSVAIKEAKEETGIKDIKVLDKGIYSIEVLTVDGHYKRGRYVNSHLHLNFTYLFEANEEENLIVKEDENKGVKWINIASLENEVREKWMYEHIYKKLNQKLEAYK